VLESNKDDGKEERGEETQREGGQRTAWES